MNCSPFVGWFRRLVVNFQISPAKFESSISPMLWLFRKLCVSITHSYSGNRVNAHVLHAPCATFVLTHVLIRPKFFLPGRCALLKRFLLCLSCYLKFCQSCRHFTKDEPYRNCKLSAQLSEKNASTPSSYEGFLLECCCIISALCSIPYLLLEVTWMLILLSLSVTPACTPSSYEGFLLAHINWWQIVTNRSQIAANRNLIYRKFLFTI